MDDAIEKGTQKIQADNNSIAIGEINISGTVTGNITIGHTILQLADARLRHELGILLKNVETTWIKGVLEKSVHEAALLELGLELREEAVDNPWRMVIEGPGQTQQTLPQGRKIKDIFDEANRLLLILGEPGSGKTTNLLQLARDLIAEVDLSTFTQPVPVILNLSTWTNKAQPLEEWLVADLNSKYRVPKKDGQRWLKERRILPLLDGLDEVKAENRAACVEKINKLVVDYGLQGLVVCSRIKDYTALNVRLAFYRAIYIQPLTPEQVDEYLIRAGDKLASLRATLQSDEALRSMAQSPLILNIMSLAYPNTSAEALRDPALATNKARRKHLLDTYIARMFNRKVGGREYDNEQTKGRLSWLAQNMQRHNQAVFLIEGLQPNWLSMRLWQWAYTLASRLVSVLIIVLLSELWPGLLSGIISGLFVGFIDVVRFELLQIWRKKEAPTLAWSIFNIIFIWLSLSFTNIILFLFIQEYFIDSTLQVGRGVLLVGLLFGLRGSRQSLGKDIQTVEGLSWSWRKALTGGLVVALAIVLACGPIFGLLFWLFSTEPAIVEDMPNQTYLQLVMSVVVMLFVPIGAIFNGLDRKIVASKSIPNEGMRLSIRNAVFGGLIAGLSTGLIIILASETLFSGMLSQMIFVLSNERIPVEALWIHVLVVGLFIGLIAVFWYGGLDVIQHYTLRFLLLIQGHTPANYARFLDYAVDRIFLQKVGGGYRFIHRLLLEHFAEIGALPKA